MSIVQIQKMMQNKGCMVVLVAIGGLTGLGLIASSFPALFGQGQGQADQRGKVLAQVGEFKIHEKDIIDAEGRMRETRATEARSSGRPINLADPVESARMRMEAVQQVVLSAVLDNLAKERGVAGTEATFAKYLEEEIKQRPAQLQAIKPQLVQMGLVKADATPQQLIEAMAKVGSPWPSDEEFRKQQLAEFNKPENKAMGLRRASFQGLIENEASKIAFTEEDLKKSYDVFHINEVSIADPKVSPEDQRKKLEQALAEIKGGKTFEAVRKELNPKANNQPTKVTRAVLEFRKEMTKVTELKPGSEPIIVDIMGMPTLAQLVKVDRELPPNFEQDKARLLTEQKKSKASDAITKELIARRGKVTWNDPGFALLARYVKLSDEEAMAQGPEKRKTELQAIIGESKTITAASNLGMELAAQIRFLAVEELFMQAQGAERTKLADEFLASASDMLTRGESAQLRMTILRYGLESGNKDAISLHLGPMIRSNGDYGTAGQGIYSQAVQILGQAKEKKLISPEDEKNVQTDLDAWLKGKIEFDRQQAEVQKAQQEAQRQAQEEAKKAQEEAQKAAGAAGTTPPSNPLAPAQPTPGSSLTTPTTGN